MATQWYTDDLLKRMEEEGKQAELLSPIQTSPARLKNIFHASRLWVFENTFLFCAG